MNDSQRHMRVMTALRLIDEAQDAIQARTTTAYAYGYIDAMLDEGEFSVEAANGLKKVAKINRDRRLSELGADPVEAKAMQPKWPQ